MHDTRILREPVTWADINILALEGPFLDFVKAVVDIDRKLISLGGEMHADCEATLLDDGSAQTHLWGINLHPDAPESERVEFDSMINIRPTQGNRSRSVESAETRSRILKVVHELVR